MAVHAAIALGLDFSPGLALCKEIWHIFWRTVHPSHHTGHFIMVLSFTRNSFRLDEENVALALESAIVGYCSYLKVTCLRDQVFSFHVSCKEVGFFILHQHNFICQQFRCHFHLWGHGGSDWTKEFKLWQLECQQEWTLVSPSKHRTKMAMEALAHVPAKSSLRSFGVSRPMKSFSFATFINYPACQGYLYPATAEEISIVEKDAGYVLHPDERAPPPPAVMMPVHSGASPVSQLPTPDSPDMPTATPLALPFSLDQSYLWRVIRGIRLPAGIKA